MVPEEYGSMQQTERMTQQRKRVGFVALSVAVSMMIAFVVLASDNTPAPNSIEALVITPDAKLTNIVTELAEKSDTMTLAEMEAKLNAWRTDPSTLLDVPEHERMQVNCTQTNCLALVASDFDVRCWLVQHTVFQFIPRA